MFKAQNGWTKEKMKAQIRAKNNGSKSVLADEEGTYNCAYRGEGGNACAAGCFIESGLYHSSFEGRSISAVMVDFPEVEEAMPLGLEGMKRLQNEHDNAIRVPPGGDMRDVLCNWIDLNVMD